MSLPMNVLRAIVLGAIVAGSHGFSAVGGGGVATLNRPTAAVGAGAVAGTGRARSVLTHPNQPQTVKVEVGVKPAVRKHLDQHRNLSRERLREEGVVDRLGKAGGKANLFLKYVSRTGGLPIPMKGSKGKKRNLSGKKKQQRRQTSASSQALSDLLRSKLSYLSGKEMREVQLALDAAVYSHTRSYGKEEGMRKVREDAEVCVILGELEMDTDALLAALLSRTLRADHDSSSSSSSGDLRKKSIPRRYGDVCAQGFGNPKLTETDVERLFGKQVTNLVDNYAHVRYIEGLAKDYLVAEPRALCQGGEARSVQEQLDLLRNLILTNVADWRVLIIRLATHLQRLRQLVEHGGDDNEEKANKMAQQALEIYGPLSHRLGIHSLRSQLEDFAFKQLWPDEYVEVTRQMAACGDFYDDMLDGVTETLVEELETNDRFMNQIECVSLTGRTKEPFSIWKKMLRQKCQAADIYDAVALRVVFKAKGLAGDSEETLNRRSGQLCYECMQIVKDKWSTMPSRDKDYVANPKPNGYRSLHATALLELEDGGLFPFEVQVRSHEMHRNSEFGMAAHWSYKGEGPAVQEKMPDTVTDELEFMSWLREELRQRKVYVFGPDGLIWDLEAQSATAADMVRDISDRQQHASKRFVDMLSIRPCVNGQVVPLHHKLNNGDVISMRM